MDKEVILKNEMEADANIKDYIVYEEVSKNAKKASAYSLIKYVVNTRHPAGYNIENVKTAVVDIVDILNTYSNEIKSVIDDSLITEPDQKYICLLYTSKTRVFLDKDYEINVDGMTEKCRLSTEWVSSELGDGTASANYLQALMKTINTYYSDVLKIYEEFGRWYLEYLKQDFKLSDLPECFKSRFAQRYIQSLLAKPFVILTGNSGTGKTRISKQFAEYLEVDFGNDEKNWLLIPVGADWTDNTKILGFYNPLAIDGKGEYEKTAILKLIERANLPENKSVPFFIILDEMNLSHVAVSYTHLDVYKRQRKGI